MTAWPVRLRLLRARAPPDAARRSRTAPALSRDRLPRRHLRELPRGDAERIAAATPALAGARPRATTTTTRSRVLELWAAVADVLTFYQERYRQRGVPAHGAPARLGAAARAPDRLPAAPRRRRATWLAFTSRRASAARCRPACACRASRPGNEAARGDADPGPGRRRTATRASPDVRDARTPGGRRPAEPAARVRAAGRSGAARGGPDRGRPRPRRRAVDRRVPAPGRPGRPVRQRASDAGRGEGGACRRPPGRRGDRQVDPARRGDDLVGLDIGLPVHADPAPVRARRPRAGVQPRRRSEQPRRREVDPEHDVVRVPADRGRDVFGGGDEPAVHGRSRRGHQRGRPAARRRHGRHGPEAARDGARGRPDPGLARRRHNVDHEAPCLACPGRRGPPPRRVSISSLARLSRSGPRAIRRRWRRRPSISPAAASRSAGTGVEVGRHIEAAPSRQAWSSIRARSTSGGADPDRRHRTDRARDRAGADCDRARIGLTGRVRPSRDLAPTDGTPSFDATSVVLVGTWRAAAMARQSRDEVVGNGDALAGVPALRAPQDAAHLPPRRRRRPAGVDARRHSERRALDRGAVLSTAAARPSRSLDADHRRRDDDPPVR